MCSNIHCCHVLVLCMPEFDRSRPGAKKYRGRRQGLILLARHGLAHLDASCRVPGIGMNTLVALTPFSRWHKSLDASKAYHVLVLEDQACAVHVMLRVTLVRMAHKGLQAPPNDRNVHPSTRRVRPTTRTQPLPRDFSRALHADWSRDGKELARIRSHWGLLDSFWYPRTDGTTANPVENRATQKSILEFWCECATCGGGARACALPACPVCAPRLHAFSYHSASCRAPQM